MKKNKIPLFIILGLSICGYYTFVSYKYDQKQNNIKEIKSNVKQANILTGIKDKFNQYIVTNKTSKLYKLENNNYIETGSITSGMNLELIEEEITKTTKYFHIKDLDLYISYMDVDKSEKQEIDQRYKNYVVFNKNIVTKDKTTFYKTKDKSITINKSFDLPIIINDVDKYYVEFNNELYYVNKSDVSKMKTSSNTNKKTRSDIRTLTYHTIYNKKTQKCTNTVICHPIEQFDEHMKYLHDNSYFTLTMNELEMFLDKKIRIPKKSIVITLDDGKYAQNAVDIVEKYKVNATYFIIGSIYDVSKIKTTYMDFQSHTYNMHNNWKCPGGNQGGEILCASNEKITNDIKKSKEVLGGDVFALAYPYFDYNDRVVSVLKKSGIRLAFIGQANTNGLSDYKTERLKLKRKTVFSSDTLKTFIEYL